MGPCQGGPAVGTETAWFAPLKGNPICHGCTVAYHWGVYAGSLELGVKAGVCGFLDYMLIYVHASSSNQKRNGVQTFLTEEGVCRISYGY